MNRGIHGNRAGARDGEGRLRVGGDAQLEELGGERRADGAGDGRTGCEGGRRARHDREGFRHTVGSGGHAGATQHQQVGGTGGGGHVDEDRIEVEAEGRLVAGPADRAVAHGVGEVRGVEGIVEVQQIDPAEQHGPLGRHAHQAAEREGRRDLEGPREGRGVLALGEDHVARAERAPPSMAEEPARLNRTSGGLAHSGAEHLTPNAAVAPEQHVARTDLVEVRGPSNGAPISHDATRAQHSGAEGARSQIGEDG